MKTIKFFEVIIIIIGIFGTIFYFTSLKPISKREFRQYEKEFRAEIDTLNLKVDRANYQLDTLRLDVDSLKKYSDSLIIRSNVIYYNLDSIKKGQIIIYRALNKKNINKNIYEKIKLFFK